MVNIYELNNTGTVNINTFQPTTLDETSEKNLFQVVGDTSFGEKDLLSLRRTGFSVTKLDVSTLDDLDLQIIRMRTEKQFIPYWHISAHSNKNFIYLNNIPLESDWLIERLNFGEIKILFLDSCESVYISDKLYGMSEHTFSLFHKVYEQDGVMVAFYFWREIYQGIHPKQAVQNVKLLMPKIAQYLWIN